MTDIITLKAVVDKASEDNTLWMIHTNSALKRMALAKRLYLDSPPEIIDERRRTYQASQDEYTRTCIELTSYTDKLNIAISQFTDAMIHLSV